jgi:hypothetical protein
MPIAADLIKYTRLIFGLRGFLGNTVSLKESRQVIAARIRDRGTNFLSIVRKGIYQYPKSPYLKLLQVAGVEFGDIESQVNKEGIEATLRILLDKGVYLSYEEFKRGHDVVRGSSRFQFKERDFDNPLLPVSYQIQSSGSRSAGTRTNFDFNHMADTAYYRLLMLEVNNALDAPIGVWKPILPAGSGTSIVLIQWKTGRPVSRWFSPVNERQVRSSLQHRMAMRYIIYGSRLWGVRLPRPEFVGLERGVIVARWMAAMKKEYGGCCLISSVSPAVKVCQAAIDNGLDIRGAHFIVSGEPLTPAKHRQIVAAGVTVTSRYTFSEAGGIGYGCLNNGETDDVHLFHDSFALIQRRRRIEPIEVDINAFVCTTLLPAAPKILLNVENDDYGVMETRSCDCSYGQLGFNTHLREIRSFAKLTGVGMTIIGTDLVRTLEEVLPQKYGGNPTDYQLLEEEDSGGQTHLSIIVSPTVGAINEDEVVATVLGELRRARHPGKLTAGVWSQAGTLRVKRMYPLSKMGKVLTLHLIKKEGPTDNPETPL